MTHVYIWHDTHTCAMTHVYIWHLLLMIKSRESHKLRSLRVMNSDYWGPRTQIICYASSVYMTWLLHMCDMTQSCGWHDSSTGVTWLTYTCVKTHSYVCHDSFSPVTWLIRTCAMTHSYVTRTWDVRESLIRVPWLIHICHIQRCDNDSFTHVTWLIHVCDTCVTWLIHVCDMTPSHMCHDSFTCVIWLIHTSLMTHPYVSHDIFWSHFRIHIRVPRLTQMCAMTHSHVCNDSLTCVPMTRFHHRTSSSCQGMRAGRYEFLKVNSKVVFYNVASWFFRISIVGAWGLGGTNSQESALTFFSITNLVASWLFRISCLEAWGLGGNSCSKGSSKEVLFITNLDAHWLLRISVFGA